MKNWERFIIYPSMLLIICLFFLNNQSRIIKKKLTITNTKGKPVITLAATDVGSGKITLYHKDNSTAVLIGNAGISLFAPGAKEQVWIGPTMGEQRAGGITLFTKDGQYVTRIGGRRTGGFIDLFSTKGSPLAALGGMEVVENESRQLLPAGGLVTYGFYGKPIVAFGTTKQGYGTLSLYDKNYKTYLSYP